MRKVWVTAMLGCVLLLSGAAVFGQVSTPEANQDAAAIRHVLADQQIAWNRGDIDAFMRGYKDSADTTFIGQTIRQGYDTILARYKKTFPTRAAMGRLDFSGVTVRMLGKDNAVVTGRFHLARTAADGGVAHGVFSLVFERDPDGWHIILDHSSS